MFLFVEDDEQLDKYLEIADALPRVRRVIVFDMEGWPPSTFPRVISLDQLRELGRIHLRAHPRLLEERSARAAVEVAVLVYTSGTTGRPKGAMISQDNICAVLASLSATLYEGLPRGAQTHRLPAAVPHRQAHDRRVRADGARVDRQLRRTRRRCSRTCASAAQPVLRRAARVEKIYSQVAIGLSEADKLQQASTPGRCRWAARWRSAARRAASRRGR